MQISFVVTAKLIITFVFATCIVQFLFFLKPEFRCSSLLLRLYRPVCVRPGRKPRRLVFSCHMIFLSIHCALLLEISLQAGTFVLRVDTFRPCETDYISYTVPSHVSWKKITSNYRTFIAIKYHLVFLNLQKHKYEPPRGKTNNVVSEQVRHKPTCTVTEKS